ncbi:hypothetical protein [Desulfobacterium sp. N47]|uniref:Uncharacterized protein n=1 Tax=uncultured Desulfobacterium sp. TaxID=201089 RepID=E1YAA9_9BACT|nr:hypothetical protein N47_H23250 [uncultured Desulfobacterium sp.]
MKDSQNLHLKVQELCDCYATNDPLKELSDLARDTDKQEAALKWLALAALHGINDSAEKITLTRAKNGEIKVIANYKKSELPSPGKPIGEIILDTMQKDYSHGPGRNTFVFGDT